MVHAIVIGTSRVDAESWAAGQVWLVPRGVDVVWLSPRSRKRVRGLTADVVLVTDAARGLPSAVLQSLLDEARVCTATRAAS